MAGCQLRVHAIQTWPGSTWLGLGFLRLGRGSSPAKAVQFLSHKHSVTLSRPTISCWVCKLSRVKSSLLETFSCYKPGIKRTCYKPGIKRSGNVPSKCLPCKRSLKMIIAPPRSSPIRCHTHRKTTIVLGTAFVPSMTRTKNITTRKNAQLLQPLWQKPSLASPPLCPRFVGGMQEQFAKFCEERGKIIK